MKKTYIHTCFVLLMGMVSFSSCSDWFDVSPKTDVKAEELFETENGFTSALAGIYISMTDGEAYGDNLSFGMLDQLAQLYDMMPDGASEKEDIYNYETTTTGGFNTKGRLADTWKKAYNLIANINNLLKWLDKNGERVLTDEQTRNMFYGEALAIRAFIHFDLLRCWGPMSYQEEGDELCIPYREVADNSKQPLLPATQIVEKILVDLTEAEQYLLFEKGESLADSERRFRFNYYAVKALMARVCCYCGKTTEAFNYADEVIKYSGLELLYTNVDDPILFNESICTLNMYKMSDNISSKFSDGEKFTTQYYCSTQTLNRVFGVTGTSADSDMRAGSNAFSRHSAEQRAISLKYIDNEEEAIPLIRLPEMYYIKCETAPLAEAHSYINLVRNKRGLSTATDYTSFATEEDRTEALNLEYRKEFYAEGKYFYFLKAHNYSELDYCSEVTLNKDKYVFPLPDAEKEYGWTSGAEEEGDNGTSETPNE